MKSGISSVLSALIGATVGAAMVEKVAITQKKNLTDISDKHLSLFLMMNQWVKVKQEGKSLEEYFQRNGYKRIAIYGMSYAGETLLNELRNTDIEVVYGIDKNADAIYSDIDVLFLEDELDEVDAIVVTAVSFFEEIKMKLLKKTGCPILSLEDILYAV